MALTDERYIAIDNQLIYRPPEFAPQMEDIYAAEYVTCTGKHVGDRVGWKYADSTLAWDALPQSMVDILVGMSGICTLEFVAPTGDIISEQVIRKSVVQLQNRNTLRGQTWWLNVSLEIEFVNAHND